MSIGIMDQDIVSYLLIPFNLEAMKLSSYYKKNNEIVVLAPAFVPERHTLFYYCKDYQDGIFPTALLTTPNVKYNGLAFTNNQYKPLDLAIEKCKPDVNLYLSMEKKIVNSTLNIKTNQQIFNSLMRAEHLRLSLDDKTLWPNYGKQLRDLRDSKLIIFHDYNLGNIPDSFQAVRELLKYARSDVKIGSKFPIQISTNQDLNNWTNLPTHGIFYQIQYNGVMDEDTFLNWIGKCTTQTIYREIIYNVTPSWYEEDEFIKQYLQKIYHQIIISRSYRSFFSLTYSKNFFTDERWEKVLDLFNCYASSYSGQAEQKYLMMINDDTMFDFVKHTYATHGNKLPPRMKFSREEIRQIFAFVQKNHPALFDDFYHCTVSSLGGKL